MRVTRKQLRRIIRETLREGNARVQRAQEWVASHPDAQEAFETMNQLIGAPAEAETGGGPRWSVQVQGDVWASLGLDRLGQVSYAWAGAGPGGRGWQRLRSLDQSALDDALDDVLQQSQGE